MRAKKELLYDGVYYDVTNWVKKHPGGKIIELYVSTGEDSTHAVQQFHQRSTKKVMSIMNSLPKRTATGEELEIDSETAERHKALTKDFLELYQQLKDEGLFKPDFVHLASRVLGIFLVFSLGAFLFLRGGILTIFGMVLQAIALGHTVWFTHEGGHHSLTGVAKLDRFIHIVGNGIIHGGAGRWWVSQHSRHHAMPQNIQHDVDLQTLPILAFNAKVVKNPDQGKGFVLQNQNWMLLAIDTLLVSLFWKFVLHPRYCLHKRNYLDMFCMTLHYIMSYNIYGFGLMGCFYYLATLFLVSVYLFGNFALSHTHMPITEGPIHWVESALCHTVNVRSSWWVDYWMGYLNYQIEHHLFPTMPQFKNKLCSARVKALAKKHNLPYHLVSYKEAVVKTYDNLCSVSKELALK